MAQEKPNPISEWLMAARTNVPVVREHFREWLAAVREEPRLIWETTFVRYVTYFVGGLVIIWMVNFAIEMFTPPPPAGTRPQAVTADFHVICTEPTCGHHFVIHRPFGFHGFPVQCPACKKETGMSARRCTSPTCGGRWVAPIVQDGHATCPICGATLE